MLKHCGAPPPYQSYSLSGDKRGETGWNGLRRQRACVCVCASSDLGAPHRKKRLQFVTFEKKYFGENPSAKLLQSRTEARQLLQADVSPLSGWNWLLFARGLAAFKLLSDESADGFTLSPEDREK